MSCGMLVLRATRRPSRRLVFRSVLHPANAFLRDTDEVRAPEDAMAEE